MSKKSILFIVIGVLIAAAVVFGFITKPAFLFPQPVETELTEEVVLTEEPEVLK